MRGGSGGGVVAADRARARSALTPRCTLDAVRWSERIRRRLRPTPAPSPTGPERWGGGEHLPPESGWAAAPLLSGEDVLRLRRRFEDLEVDPEHAFFASSEHAPRDVARQVDQEIKRSLAPALARLLPGYEPFLGAYISKGPLGWNAVDLHQDWTYTLEPEQRAVIVWCPLLDVDEQGGALHLVPGSHRWSSHLRGSGLPAPLGAALEQARTQAVGFSLPAGTGLLYDAGVLHGSPPNCSEQVRVAAAVALAPRGAQLVHYHAEDDGPVEGYLIDEAWYTTQTFGERPEGYARADPPPERSGTHDLSELELAVAP